MLKIAYDAQLQKQRPPAAVCPAVAMPVVKTLIFKDLFENVIC